VLFIENIFLFLYLAMFSERGESCRKQQTPAMVCVTNHIQFISFAHKCYFPTITRGVDTRE